MEVHFFWSPPHCSESLYLVLSGMEICLFFKKRIWATEKLKLADPLGSQKLGIKGLIKYKSLELRYSCICLFTFMYLFSKNRYSSLFLITSVWLNIWQHLLPSMCQLNQLSGRQEEVGFTLIHTLIHAVINRRQGMCLGRVFIFLTNKIFISDNAIESNNLLFYEWEILSTYHLQRLAKQKHITLEKYFLFSNSQNYTL